MFCVSKMEIIGCVRSAQFSIKSRFVNVWCVASTRIVLDEILIHTWVLFGYTKYLNLFRGFVSN